MKSILAIIGLGIGMLVSAHAAPPISAEQAVKLAGDYLKEQGQGKERYISSLYLEPTTMARSKFNWVITWTPAIDLGDRTETGLQISMDGTVSRLVTKTAREQARDVNRVGSRSIR